MLQNKSLTLFGLALWLMSSLLHADSIWKRSSMLKADLANALSLPADQLCFELGTYSCIDIAHNFALGGRDPFARAQYQSMEKPSQLTPTAFERTILNTCIERVKRDTAQPVVFRYYPLDKTLNDTPDSKIQAQIEELYRRFYQRTPTAAEVSIALTLADRGRFGATGMANFSQALCLAIGSQWAYLFF